MSYFEFLILAFSIKFCLIKIDLSDNTVWPQAANWLFSIFVLSNEDVELEINCKMRLFDSLSTTVMSFKSAGALKRELDGQYSTLVWKVMPWIKIVFGFPNVRGTIKEMEIWSENGKNISSGPSWWLLQKLVSNSSNDGSNEEKLTDGLTSSRMEFKSPIACNLALKLYEI